MSASTLYPSPFNAISASRKSFPLCEVRNPVTFSKRTMGGRRSPMSLRMRMNPQNADDWWPARPLRLPANERSLQGNEAVARIVEGMVAASSSWMSPRTNSSDKPNCRRYISCFFPSISFANTVRQPACSRPIRIRPIPAKNSATVRSLASGEDITVYAPRTELPQQFISCDMASARRHRITTRLGSRNECSQIRRTLQPRRRSSRSTLRSRARLRASFADQ